MKGSSGLNLLTAKFWLRIPNVVDHDRARRWVERLAHREFADNTVVAYAQDLDGFLRWCASHGIKAIELTADQGEDYIAHLARLRVRRRTKVLYFGDAATRTAKRPLLSRQTLNRRLTVARLWFDYLASHGLRTSNPFTDTYLGRNGKREERRAFRTVLTDGIWIPDESQWTTVQNIVHSPFCTLRDRLMLHLSYDCALRVSELCAVELDHLHLGIGKKANFLYVPPSKNRRERRVPFTDAVVAALVLYLEFRRTITAARGPLFVSESRRNYGEGVTIWTWEKRIAEIRLRASLPRLKTHTMRHLCLTDLARGGMDVLYIKEFAGHKSLDSTQVYLHLASEDIARSLATSMAHVREWRSGMFLSKAVKDVG